MQMEASTVPRVSHVLAYLKHESSEVRKQFQLEQLGQVHLL